jgi:outer membrane murein-binding lipoprotein Lpp
MRTTPGTPIQATPTRSPAWRVLITLAAAVTACGCSSDTRIERLKKEIGELRAQLAQIIDQGGAKRESVFADVVTARQIVLVDTNGQRRVLLDTDTPRISFFDATGKPRAMLGTSDGAPQLVFCTPDGSILMHLGDDVLTFNDALKRTRVCLWAQNDGPMLKLNGEDGKPRAALAAGPTGPVLIMYDGDEKQRIGLTVYDDVGPHLDLSDERGKPVTSLAGGRIRLRGETKESGLTIFANSLGQGLWIDDAAGTNRLGLSVNNQDQSASLYIRDSHGIERLQLGLFNADERAALCIRDAKGTARATMQTFGRSGSILLLCDRDGKPLWSTPADAAR